jgi:patatin-related protein
VDPDTPAPIRTRFTVDILSGTSAGGINAVYLAKALANGQTIDQLKRLWVEEGDILKLINDAKSVEQLDGLKAQKPPRSLLNSQRMYRRLLEALDGMEEDVPSAEKSRSPYLEELDLFVTATDFRGLPIQLRLSDDVVEERRHRNVFHFRYADEHSEEACNDFHAGNDPFLAYAARCTSAFPFAFDPMKLSDIDSVLKTMTAHRNLEDLGLERDRWQRFFPDYRQPAGGPTHHPETYDFTRRPFVDGGYLDNRPFGHAIDALAIRNSGVPVARKLIYIDPSPELSAQWSQGDDPINPVENVAAAFSLARYETIREDLQRVRGRNRLIERVESIVSERERDVRNRRRLDPVRSEDFGSGDLKDMIEAEGVAYGGYHRLKVGALTDEIARLITRAAGFDLQSDEFQAIRYLVREWRELHYEAYRGHQESPAETEQGPVGKKTQNEFLVRYDLAYRIRRLDFVLNRIDRLYGLGSEAARILKDLGVKRTPKTDSERLRFRTELSRLRTDLDEVLAGLRKTRAGLELPGATNPLHKEVVDLARDAELSAKRLRSIFAQPTEEKRSSEARKVLLDSPAGVDAFRRLAAGLERRISDATVPAASACEDILNGPEGRDGEAHFADAAVKAVRHYYESYDHYDMISYPILYSTEVGEEIDAVDVLRVSPEDATSLIDERDPNERRRKLAGTSLRNFGAFLDRGWRRNDILWGRLDGAERIVSALLPGNEYEEKKRKELIKEAQLAILEEEILGEDRDQVLQLIANALATTDSTGGNEAALRRLVEQAGSSSINSVLEEVLRSHLTKEELLEFFRNSYEVNRKVDPKTTLGGLSRSTRVVGEMLESIADGYRGVGRWPAAWLARLGRVFWGLVEVAVPRSLAGEIFRYWLVLLYFFEALLIAAATIFVKPQVQLLGFITLGVTGAIHLVTLLLRDYMLGRRAWLRVLVAALVLALLFLALVGADTLFDLRARLFGRLLDL